MNGVFSSYANPSDVQGVCPDGWHLPSDTEWIELEMFLGMSEIYANATGWRETDEGNKLKTTSGWDNNGNGLNSVGFSAFPAGGRDDLGFFYGLIENTEFWSTLEYNNDSLFAKSRQLHSSYSDILRHNLKKNYGISVRCIKDD